MKQIDIEKLLEIGISLSGEKNAGRLLATILTTAMDIAECDGGTLYIISEGALWFRVMITRSMGVYKGGEDEAIDMPPVQINSDKHVSSYAAKAGTLINIPDVYNEERFDFSGTRRYDALTGYKTTSMLCVPMKNDYGEVIGLLQLINALDEEGRTTAFEQPLEKVIMSLASQAAICLTNMNYANEIKNLLDSFVRVMSAAIDESSPYNANHTRNMVKYAERFVEWLNETGNEWSFTKERRDELIMSIWLHDVGKLATPISIMNKENRLGTAADGVLHRFEQIGLLNHIKLLEGVYDEQRYIEENAVLEDARRLVESSDRAPYLTDETLERIRALGRRAYTDYSGNLLPYLTPDELESLLVRKGTLTDAERVLMQEHVEVTSRMLDEMAFSDKLKNVPRWASMHHEFLSGDGYPKRLTGEDIPREVRLITILDIFDALTARDRPYKRPMPAEKAFAILNDMARAGQVDAQILELFKKSGAYIEDMEIKEGE